MNLNDTDRARLTGIEVLFTDIDDTVSSDGKITLSAYEALWKAHDQGLLVVPVTGRPAGWCDHIARMWPVAGVVGENGGLYFRMTDSGMERVFVHDEETRAGFRHKLETIKHEILQSVPGTAIASDQTYREYDLAIDYCEDVPRLDKGAVRSIVEIFEKHGACAKVSSIHVNGWFGDFDKLSMARRFAAEVCGMNLDENNEKAAFAGDSPNDEPMFGFFNLSFGVANISDFINDIETRPAYITNGRSGAGFAEIVHEILNAKESM